jgi:hypothetical protein
VRISGKSSTAGSPRISELGLIERRSGQEMEVNTMEDGEMVMEDMDYAKVKNKFTKPNKSAAGETGPELSSDEELRVQFSTVINRKTK